MRQIFSQKLRFWIENFSTSQILNWKFIVPEDMENITFRIIIFQRKTNFEKIKFWIQFLRNKISLKNSYVNKIVLTQFAPQKTKHFSVFVLILKGMTFYQTFSLEIRIWNEFFWKKKNQILKQTFSCTKKIWNEKFPKCQILNWKFFVPADFENKTFGIIIFWRKIVFGKTAFEFIFFGEIRLWWKIHIWIKSFWLNLLSKKQQIFLFSCLF